MSVSEAWSASMLSSTDEPFSEAIEGADAGEAASSSEQSVLAPPGPGLDPFGEPMHRQAASGSTFAASLHRHSTGLPVSIPRQAGSLSASKPVAISMGSRRQPHVVSSPSGGLLLGLDKFEPPHELLARTLPQELNYLGEPMTFKPGSSVVEGRGSKLQGQAQRRFRAAIMRQTGFLEHEAETREAHKLQKERESPVEAY